MELNHIQTREKHYMHRLYKITKKTIDNYLNQLLQYSSSTNLDLFHKNYTYIYIYIYMKETLNTSNGRDT